MKNISKRSEKNENKYCHFLLYTYLHIYLFAFFVLLSWLALFLIFCKSPLYNI